MHQCIVSPVPFFQKDSKECLTEGNGRAKVMKSLRAMVLWKLNSTARKKPMCEFQEKKETAKNLSKKGKKKSSRNKQSIMESLILAQDERWRRA